MAECTEGENYMGQLGENSLRCFFFFFFGRWIGQPPILSTSIDWTTPNAKYTIHTHTLLTYLVIFFFSVAVGRTRTRDL
ncbi:uncharacterized protein DS421_11g324020 [Arachis hypogaea]|nr:uncharacterized protein DS421_11g324020 [Arachis hypogaea]